MKNVLAIVMVLGLMASVSQANDEKAAPAAHEAPAAGHKAAKKMKGHHDAAPAAHDAAAPAASPAAHH